MIDKLNFFERCSAQEAYGDEGPIDRVPHFGKYFKNGVWESYITGQPIHDGDCTKCPYTCDLCAL
jgi:hypothetical protein